jgi:hypothetical protein
MGSAAGVQIAWPRYWANTNQFEARAGLNDRARLGRRRHGGEHSSHLRPAACRGSGARGVSDSHGLGLLCPSLE